MYAELETPVQYIKGVGPRLGDFLSRKGFRTILDLLEHYPRTYEDRRSVRNIRNLIDGETVSLKAKIIKVSTIPIGSRRRMYDVLVADESGQIHCKYFRIPFKGYFEKLTPGLCVRVVGKVIIYRGKMEFHHPDIYEFKNQENRDELVPIYVETQGLTSRKISRLIRSALNALEVSRTKVPETLPEWLLRKYNLKGRLESFKRIHIPGKEAGPDYMSFSTPYHRRIKFEEFFWLELILAFRQQKLQSQPALKCVRNLALYNAIVKSLPFELTKDQKNALDEILNDLEKPYSMHRLLQGDVGSGKTLVAFLAAAVVISNKFQVALMVPTEILAEQHFKQAQKLFEPLGIKVALLTSQQTAKKRNQTLAQLKEGTIDFVIGTQALIQQGVEFSDLALVIIDEQHRFGVEQRQELKNKGLSPHFLLMTATPIPRSLALTIYGDLEISFIRQKPMGRVPIQTRAVYQNKRPKVLEFMCNQIKKGRQAYFIFPLVEESEKIDLKNAVQEYEKLVLEFPDIRFGLLHGRLSSEEKEKVMNDFRQNKIQVLVSTTVIEVGVDVPNANLIIVEHAERFGLSQLHQLRGRVGRGSHKSFCVLLMGNRISDISRDRVMWLEKTDDGFKLAEVDLQIRGPGEFMGTRQSGALGFKLADLVRDIDILHQARAAARELVAMDPFLKLPEHAVLKNNLSIHQKFFVG